MGRSPHTRGRRTEQSHKVEVDRSIPAYAGEANSSFQIENRIQVDPRIRGGGAPAAPARTRCRGRSPHTRGRLSTFIFKLLYEGSIPAYAGEAAGTPAGAIAAQVDPRIRGGGAYGAGTSDSPIGRSPHTRGRQATQSSWGIRSGSIPAYAGEAAARYQFAWEDQVDPRIRGGGRQRGGAYDAIYRSIPAYAGEAVEAARVASRIKVDPRIRGGGNNGYRIGLGDEGRSPHTRGRRYPNPLRLK